MKQFLCFGLMLFLAPAFIFSAVSNSEERDKQNNEKEGPNQIYSKSAKGFRMYLTDIQDEKPDLYNALNPLVKDLENRETTARTISIGGGIGGIALIGLGFYTLFSESSPQHGPSSTGLIEFGAGAALGFGSFLLGNFMYPKSDDYNRFINKHNKLNPDNPLKMETLKLDISYNFKRDGGGFCLAYRF